MNELEIVGNKFRELFPDMLSGKGVPLSPFIDIFEEGWNCGEISSKLDAAEIIRGFLDDFLAPAPDLKARAELVAKAEKFLEETK